MSGLQNVAEALAGHDVRYIAKDGTVRWFCPCGEWETTDVEAVVTGHAQHLADLVSAHTPVASRERVAEVLREFGHPTEHDGWVLFADELDDFHNALLAAGVFRDEATVKAEALEEAARQIVVPGASSRAADWLQSQAAQIRHGGQS